MFTQEFWDERYQTKDALWSGRPNQRLVENVASLRPGDALDIGCGEGADAIWLAQQGFRVTAVDLSSVALNRARSHAEAAGVQVDWQQRDVRTWQPEPDSFDLVSQQYLHLPVQIRAAQHRAFAAAVRSGGTLLVVGHHPADQHTTMRRPRHAELMFTAEEEAAQLDPDEWDVVASSPTRESTDPDGASVMITDAVLRAVRRD